MGKDFPSINKAGKHYEEVPDDPYLKRVRLEKENEYHKNHYYGCLTGLTEINELLADWITGTTKPEQTLVLIQEVVSKQIPKQENSK